MKTRYVVSAVLCVLVIVVCTYNPDKPDADDVASDDAYDGIVNNVLPRVTRNTRAVADGLRAIATDSTKSPETRAYLVSRKDYR